MEVFIILGRIAIYTEAADRRYGTRQDNRETQAARFPLLSGRSAQQRGSLQRESALRSLLSDRRGSRPLKGAGNTGRRWASLIRPLSRTIPSVVRLASGALVGALMPGIDTQISEGQHTLKAMFQWPSFLLSNERADDHWNYLSYSARWD